MNTTRTAAKQAYLAKSYALIATQAATEAEKLTALAAEGGALTSHWAGLAAEAAQKAADYRARAAALTA